jgi:hypothetical protein
VHRDAPKAFVAIRKNALTMKVLQLLSILIVPTSLYIFFFLIAKKKNWITLRFLSLNTTVCLLVLVVILSRLAQDTSFLKFGVVISIITGCSLLSLPVVAPEIMKQLNLRW